LWGDFEVFEVCKLPQSLHFVEGRGKILRVEIFVVFEKF
jgi:hypothetical protein